MLHLRQASFDCSLSLALRMRKILYRAKKIASS
jgi:hypothetical protein